MAFRVEAQFGPLARIGALLTLGAAAAFAQPFTYQVRHRHLHGGAMGTLRITLDSISFDEPGKNAKHSRQWNFPDVQQLSVGGTELRILTYEDQKWQIGRDREYVFDRLPEDLPNALYSMLAVKLDQRFVGRLAQLVARPFLQTGAKLRHRWGGSEGVLLVDADQDRIVYQSKAPNQSRTWRFEDIDVISRSGPLSLSITTREQSDFRHATPTEFVFDLKEPLEEFKYNELWKRIEESKRRIGF